MKQNIIIKGFVAIAMMFASSIVMADKLDIQDSTVLVIGKGQTNRNGLFVATDSIPVDSIFVDEIVLTYENRKADTLLIMDSTEGKIIFSNKVTNGMSKHEMESKCFSFMSGHTYVIRHGVKSWNLIIKNTCDRQDNVKGDSTTCTATSGGIIDEENKTDYSGLMWLIIGIVFGVVGCFVYYALSKRKKKRPVEGEIETGSIEEAGEGLDSSSIEKMDKQNDDDIKKLKDKANKPDRRLKQLTRIAKLLGLKNDQLDCIEREIKSLQEKAKYDNVKESEIDIKDKVANELFNQFGKLAIFSDLITRIKEERKSNIKYNDLLEFLKHLSGKDFYESFKGNESKSNAGYEEKSHTQWLKKCLKQKFNYEYDENKSVEKNLNFLIDSRIGKSGNVEEQPTDDKEALFAQRLEEEKGKWQQEVNQEKEEELNKKNEEIQELKNQLDNKESEVATLNQKISGKNGEIEDLKNTHDQERQVIVDAIIGKLHLFADKIEWCPIIDPCSEDTMVQCNDIENRLKENLKKMKSKFSEFTADAGDTPEQIHSKIQKVLEEEITKDESVVNSLCRFYAYSQLPFMTDKTREYGVWLRRKNIHDIYEALENLYIQFGIGFQIPPLFVMEAKDGNYDDVTGQVYSELGNLCPNVTNHCSNIDSKMKLKNVIFDMDRIGYAVDGVVREKARILTF